MARARRGRAVLWCPAAPGRRAAHHAPLLLNFAGNDERINGMWPPYEAALKAAHVKDEACGYPGVEHGFDNDTTPRFDAQAASLAWNRTLTFFAKNLRTD